MDKKVLWLFTLLFLAAGTLAQAQQSKKIHCMGYLSLGLGIQPGEEAFQQSLRELGYVDGQTSSLSGDLPKARPISFLSLPPNWSV
jgi:hypothetical protein